MTAETMIAYLTEIDERKRLDYQTSYHCAPVLTGMKASNLVMLPRDRWRLLQAELYQTQILCIPLCRGEMKDAVLLYRYDMLDQMLSAPEIRTFLAYFGYTSFDVPSVILELKRRYQAYAGEETVFPHEMGIILNYPVADVEGFIKHHGENYIFCGYWKVYHNPEEARVLFNRYDKAREWALNQIAKGASLSDTAAD